MIFFFNDTATTEIYTLSLHDPLPISPRSPAAAPPTRPPRPRTPGPRARRPSWRRDRKSTRLNSSHVRISYAVFCLKKKELNRRGLQAKTNKIRPILAHHEKLIR